MQVIDSKISLDELKTIAQQMFGDMVKAVVDVEKRIMVVGASLLSDEELYLLENGSQQEHLWGINLYPALFGDSSWIEFDSMINLRPSFGNRSRGVDDSQLQEKIQMIVQSLVTL